MDTLIKFRVATEDKARFERAAVREGRTLSDWVRTQCFRGAATKPKMPISAKKVSEGVVPRKPAHSARAFAESAPRATVPVERRSIPKQPTQTIVGRGSLKRTETIPKPDWKK